MYGCEGEGTVSDVQTLELFGAGPALPEAVCPPVGHKHPHGTLESDRITLRL